MHIFHIYQVSVSNIFLSMTHMTHYFKDIEKQCGLKDYLENIFLIQLYGRNSFILFLVSKFWLWNKTYTSRCSFSTRVLNQSHIIFCSTTCVLASVCNCIYSDFYIDYYQFHSFTNYIIQQPQDCYILISKINYKNIP